MVRTRSVNGAGSTRKLANGQWASFDDVFICQSGSAVCL